MYLRPRKKNAKPMEAQEAQEPVVPSKKSDNSLAATEKLQKPGRRELLRDGIASIFRSASGRSTRAPTPIPSPSPEKLTQNGTTAPMHTSSVSLSEGNGTTVTAPSRVPLKQGELLPIGLWTEAYNELSVECKQDLECVDNTDSDKPEKLDEVKQLLEHAIQARRDNIASQWKIKWGGKEINVREKAEKLVGWIAKFKEIGDIAVQYDPGHAALPWAGVRFILIACLSQMIPPKAPAPRPSQLSYLLIHFSRLTPY